MSRWARLTRRCWGVAPHVIEVETDSGAILFADADRVAEVACFRGSRVRWRVYFSSRGY